MKIVVLDGYTENPGDLSWDALRQFGDLTVYNRTSYEESPLIAERMQGADIVVMNKTPISRQTIDCCPDLKLIAVLATGFNVVDIDYVFEFLGVPENKPILESDLEKALVVQIEKFLLELGRGFMFVGTQQRVTLNNTHYYVDMVFYNKILRAYVLIELKTKKLTPEAAGQLNMYLNYYAAEVNDPDDNPPIGIILCTEKDSIAAEYALGGLSNNIFASRYVLYMPDKEQLIAQVEAVLKNWHEKKDNCHD